jgi:hypothetical protein
MPEEQSGWVAFTPGSVSALPDDVRGEVERRLHERAEARGPLLGVVQVRVYEHAAHAYVTFPSDARLRPDAEPGAIAAVVARARDELGRWR